MVTRDLVHQLVELVLGKTLGQGISNHVLRGDAGDGDGSTLDLLSDVVVGKVRVLASVAIHRIAAHGGSPDCSSWCSKPHRDILV